MKNGIFLLLLLAAGAWAQQVQWWDITWTNTRATVPIVLNKGTMTTNFVECRAAGVLKFAVPSNGVLAAAYGGTGGRLQSGTGAVDTASNQVVVTFGTAYAAAPVVFVTGDRGTNLVYAGSVTPSNFVAYAQAAGTNNFNWLSLGN